MTIPLTFRRTRADTNRARRLAPGFTLTEILIAIALIVTIVAVAVTNLGTLL
ncbi:MAG: prepilin-type N-terminal cleavage/methylation domain-containing protein, partial [Gammaproteobacteria bacterium]